MNLGEIAGEICKRILPIPEETFLGSQSSSVAICTLSSIDLLKEIANSDAMKNIAIAGRLLSENKGIDRLLKYVSQNPRLGTIIVCGREVVGHRTGHALFCLHKFGVDENNRIINSTSPDPVLSASRQQIQYFQNQITLVDKIGETKLENIIALV
jgi:tetrahydromethanopterin S-methyltransferase subunit A